MRKIFRFLLNRLTIITLFVLLQICTMIYLLFYFKESYSFVAATTVFFEFAIIIDLVNRDMLADLKLPWLAVVMLLIVVLRDILISGIRMVAANKNVVIAADIFGKVKSFFLDLRTVKKVLNALSGVVSLFDMYISVARTAQKPYFSIANETRERVGNFIFIF